MNVRRAKIICTIGPASCSKNVLFSLMQEGMDVARMNFSHGTHAFHRQVVRTVREGIKKFGRPVSIMQDLQGIKIRVGLIKDGAAELRKGNKVLVYPGHGLGDDRSLFVSYPLLLRDAARGDKILLDDGLIQLTVTGKTDKALITQVVEGGIIKDRKGVNLPGMQISQRSFTDKDRADLELGLQMKVDYVAISFVRTAHDVSVVKAWMKRRGCQIPIIAKIEKPEALVNIDAILDEAAGIMIARGDLGVEVMPEEVPIIQKGLIEKANKKGKIVITATQMLESMKEHLRPTRAEATDVANAVLDGTDAVMLSAETASGAHPREAINMMDNIVRFTESAGRIQSVYERGDSYADALADAACRAAEDIRAKVLVAFTESGFTARLLSKFRPGVPIIAFTPDRSVIARLPFFWGVTPLYMKPFNNLDQMLGTIEMTLLSEKIVRKNDRIVIIACSPLPTQAKTNFMKLHEIGG
ncbi:MAG: pyruvate kinase [Nitrospirae bacterium]|nr:MAG: pyruvate kinase [Nitrospirota bacterium]